MQRNFKLRYAHARYVSFKAGVVSCSGAALPPPRSKMPAPSGHRRCACGSTEHVPWKKPMNTCRFSVFAHRRGGGKSGLSRRKKKRTRNRGNKRLCCARNKAKRPRQKWELNTRHLHRGFPQDPQVVASSPSQIEQSRRGRVPREQVPREQVFPARLVPTSDLSFPQRGTSSLRAIRFSHLPFQEAEDSCRTVVPLEREWLRVHREHSVQVAEHHVGEKAVAHEAQLV